MNVAFLEASSGSVVGGSLTGMLELLRGIDRGRIAPFVVLYEEKPVVAELREQGVPVRVVDKRRLPKEHALQSQQAYARAKRIGVFSAVLRAARATATFVLETIPSAWALRAIFREGAVDLVYVCNGFRANADAIVAAISLGKPCVVHAKGFDKFTFVERALSRRVASCVSMTKAIETHCLRGGMRPQQHDVIYDGLDLERFRPRRDRREVRAELGVAEDAELVGVVGNIQEWKGQRVFVDAVARLRSRRPKLVGLIVGGTHRSGAAYAAELRSDVERLGLQERVLFTGARTDVADLMGAMDVLAHTSVRGEPFGRVIIEGMAAGRVVIATRAGGVPEFVRDGEDCVLVTPGDAGELATTLDSVLSDPAHRSRLEAGARISVERFSLAHQVEAMTQLFEEVARSTRT